MIRKFTVSIFVFAGTISAFGQKGEASAVKKTFDNYKSSILNDRGEDAVKYVDSRTVAYYSDIVELVKNADSTEVETLSLLDKLMVFSIRHRASREEILSFDGKKLIIYAIKSGMVGKNSVANISIGEVIIDGNFGRGQVIANGEKAPIYFHFYKEEGEWKIDLTSLFPISTMAFKKMIDNSGQSENDFFFATLEMLTGRKPGHAIWEQVKQ